MSNMLIGATTKPTFVGGWVWGNLSHRLCGTIQIVPVLPSSCTFRLCTLEVLFTTLWGHKGGFDGTFMNFVPCISPFTCTSQHAQLNVYPF